MIDPRSALDAIGQLPDVEIDIAQAALQFARIDAPGADWSTASAHLSELAREGVAMAREMTSDDVAARAGALAGLITGRHRYAGDAETYDDPANANLIQVIARRRGLPVALGIIWLHCTRAIGWSAHGLDFPGHFLIALESAPVKGRKQPGPHQTVLDVFSGGVPLDARDLRGLLKRIEGPVAELRPGVLAPMPARRVLLRLQENIRARRLGAGDVAGALVCTLDMLRVAPDHAGLWREAAQMHQRLDQVQAALRCYERVLALVPQGDGALRTRAVIEELRGPVALKVSPVALLVGGAFFMELLDGSIINTALPQMARSFGVGAVDLNPGVSAYLLTVAVFILPSGWLAERFGARLVFTSAIALFTASSVLCGLCNSAPWFIAARVVQGVGGAMMVPVGRLVVLRTTAKPDLMRAIAVLTWPALTAPVLGPPLGGFIAEYLSWRWIFMLNVPVGLLGIALTLRLIPHGHDGVRRPFDAVGFLLGAGACLTLTLALEELGHVDTAWTEPLLLGLGAAALTAAFIRRMGRHPHPLVGLMPFQVPSFKVTLLGGSAMRVMISTMPFLLPLLFQLGFGLDPFHAGLLVLTLFAGNIGIKPLTTPILRRFGFRGVLVWNGLVQAAAMVGCALLTPAAPVAVIVPLLVLAGASRSLQFTALNTLAFAEVPEQWTGTANTLFSLAFQFSVGMGVAVGAVALRASGTTGLAAFHTAFITVAVLMALSSLSGLLIARDAGAAVAGRGL